MITNKDEAQRYLDMPTQTSEGNALRGIGKAILALVEVIEVLGKPPQYIVNSDFTPIQLPLTPYPNKTWQGVERIDSPEWLRRIASGDDTPSP